MPDANQMTPTVSSATLKQATPTAFVHHVQNGQRLCGRKYDTALRSFHDRYESWHVDDQESLNAERKTAIHRQWAPQGGITATWPSCFGRAGACNQRSRGHVDRLVRRTGSITT